jgi:site-specific DNA recombinase
VKYLSLIFSTFRFQLINYFFHRKITFQHWSCSNYENESPLLKCTKTGKLTLGFFGGTYESAKTDERKEFNRMIRFVKNQKEGVSFILVYSLDRFSRTGDNAIFISSELKKRGISIVSVTQPIDVSTHSGVLQQNIQFIFSKYDNDLRREKCIAGMREKLLRGEWTGVLPVGYSYDHAGVKQYRVKINERGKIIAKAFALKVQGLTNSDIALRVSSAGYKVSRKRITEIIPMIILRALIRKHRLKFNEESLSLKINLPR